jgi:predicted glycoside hydrolase/deacetylase ChbG (UPF0249 family)
MKKLLLRFDDYGSAPAANAAIETLARYYPVLNVSVLVCASKVRGDLERFSRQYPEICYGIHLAVTSEWDCLKWGPIGGFDPSNGGLVDQSGYFHPETKTLLSVSPDVILEEVRAQIETAMSWGIPFSYVDEHMVFGWLPQVRKGIVEIAAEFNLIYQPDLPSSSIAAIEKIGQKPTLLIFHPALSDESSVQFYNASHPPGKVAKEREAEYHTLLNGEWRSRFLQENQLVTYRDL